MIALKRILVATDFGEAAEAALNYGREFARLFGARVECEAVDTHSLREHVVAHVHDVEAAVLSKPVA